MSHVIYFIRCSTYVITLLFFMGLYMLSVCLCFLHKAFFLPLLLGAVLILSVLYLISSYITFPLAIAA